MPVAAARVASTLASLALRDGRVPNGSRTYYSNRSQPPVLSIAVTDALRALSADTCPTPASLTERSRLLRIAPAALAAELHFWRSRRSLAVLDAAPGRATLRPAAVSEGDPQLSRYAAEEAGPRPESYREDLAVALAQARGSRRRVGEAGKEASRLTAREAAETIEGGRRLMREIRSAAESGWDFSSRWWCGGETSEAEERGGVEDREVEEESRGGGGGPEWDLSRTRTTGVVPVDLNVLLALLEWNLGEDVTCRRVFGSRRGQPRHVSAST